jgi:hypothetical protein
MVGRMLRILLGVMVKLGPDDGFDLFEAVFWA